MLNFYCQVKLQQRALHFKQFLYKILMKSVQLKQKHGVAHTFFILQTQIESSWHAVENVNAIICTQTVFTSRGFKKSPC